MSKTFKEKVLISFQKNDKKIIQCSSVDLQSIDAYIPGPITDVIQYDFTIMSSRLEKGLFKFIVRKTGDGIEKKDLIRRYLAENKIYKLLNVDPVSEKEKQEKEFKFKIQKKGDLRKVIMIFLREEDEFYFVCFQKNGTWCTSNGMQDCFIFMNLHDVVDHYIDQPEKAKLNKGKYITKVFKTLEESVN